MAYLFKIEDNVIYPHEETLLIYPFDEIWERDTDSKKVNALEEFKYIEFMSSMRSTNPFKNYREDEKPNIIKAEVIKQENWEPDELIKDAVDKIKLMQKEASFTYRYYMSAKEGAEKVISFFESVDLNERTERGMPVYKPKEITDTIEKTEKVLTNLKGMEKKVEEELFENSRNKSDKQISEFAMPESVKR